MQYVIILNTRYDNIILVIGPNNNIFRYAIIWMKNYKFDNDKLL